MINPSELVFRAATLCLFAVLAFSIASSADDAGLERLTELMTGSFSSEAQSKTDESYYDIRLEMARIWADRDDAVWLYVEQAVATHLDKPYRQRVYRLELLEDGQVVSRVYALEEPSAAVGAWRKPELLAGITPDELVLRKGCAVTLKQAEDGRWAGSTRDRDCQSSLRGATYATSEVEIGPDGLTSWDRGFDAEGKQVWGSTEGPYDFRQVR